MLYPTLFLPVTARAELSGALRGYNPGSRYWRWQKPPSFDRSAPLRRWTSHRGIKFGKANGACCVFMRGNEVEWLLSTRRCCAQGSRPSVCRSAFTQAVSLILRSIRPWMLSSINCRPSAVHTVTIRRAARFQTAWSFVESTSQLLPYAVNALLIRTQAERDSSAITPPCADPGAAKERNIKLHACATIASTSLSNPPTIFPTGRCVGEDHIPSARTYGHAGYSTTSNRSDLAKAVNSVVLGRKIRAKMPTAYVFRISNSKTAASTTVLVRTLSLCLTLRPWLASLHARICSRSKSGR